MPWSERIGELRTAVAARESAGLTPQVSVRCASCGQTAVVQRPDLDDMDSMFLGWYLADQLPYLDYCPDCAHQRAPRR